MIEKNNMVSLQDVKEKRRAKILVKNLEDLLVVFDGIQKMLQPFKYYTPARDLLRSLEDNRTFAKLALRQIVNGVLKK